MPASSKVLAVGDEKDFPPLPPASPSPIAPAELSADATTLQLVKQLADQQIASETRIHLMLAQHQLVQTATETRIKQLEKDVAESKRNARN
jgi:hypothetical protein